jgi:hypothetical protein
MASLINNDGKEFTLLGSVESSCTAPGSCGLFIDIDIQDAYIRTVIE